MKSRKNPLTVAAMAVAVVCISATAPLTAYATASPLAMAFWRNALGFAALGPVLLLLRHRQVAHVVRGERRLVRREQWRPLLFGSLAATALALHFAAFMTSTRMTSVAMSTALVATQPVWQALIAVGQGTRFSRRTWTGLALAMTGAAAAAGLDIRSGGTALAGDLLAVVGAMAQAGYTALSQKARADVSTPLYSTVTSLVCGLELLAVCLLDGIPLTGFDTSTHLSLLGLLLLPQLLGLGSMSFALGRASATMMSVLLLLEAPVAALAAWALMGQSFKFAAMPGLLLLIVGVMMVVLTEGEHEQTAPQQVYRHAGTPPYPDHAPYPPHPLSTAGGFFATRPEPHAPAWAFTSTREVLPYSTFLPRPLPPDPREEWAGLNDDRSPTPAQTLTLSHHATGAFATMSLTRPWAPPPAQQAPPPPAATPRRG